MDTLTLLIIVVSVFVPILIVGVVMALVVVPLVRGGMMRQRLLQTGMPAQATIMQLNDTGVTINNNPVAELVLDVRPPDRPPYQARTRVTISRLRIPSVQPGMVVPVRFDPNDPSKITLAM